LAILPRAYIFTPMLLTGWCTGASWLNYKTALFHHSHGPLF
jgi:hypothetical protein